MKFILGPSDYEDLVRGEERSYLLGNGLGGYQAMTAVFSVNRSDQGILVAADPAPNNRINYVHRLSEELTTNDSNVFLSSQQREDGPVEDGYRYLSSFSYDYLPEWTYDINGISVIRKSAVKYSENTAALTYEISNRSDSACSFTVTPSYLFAPKGQILDKIPGVKVSGNLVTLISYDGESAAHCTDNADHPAASDSAEKAEMRDGLCASKSVNETTKDEVSGIYKLYFKTNGEVSCCDTAAEKLSYPADAADGRPGSGLSWKCMSISANVQAGESFCLQIVFSTESIICDAGKIISDRKKRQNEIQKQAGFTDPAASVLAESADAFVVYRDSTDGKSIIAGYPLFGDWGRDTMTALQGCCLSTGRYKDAKSILNTFLQYEYKGLIPNLFPEGGNKPEYNSADAPLLLINCIWQYHTVCSDKAFIEKALPVLERIIAYYKEGTLYHIHMDSDSLIMAGDDLEQVTWMDVCVDGILPTPRHGKPVEINALWYNALCIMGKLSLAVGQKGRDYFDIAEKVKESFLRKFWVEDGGYLKDVVSGTEADMQIRCNQIFAAAVPFTMLSPEQIKSVVDVVYRHLYTPLGLRSLSPKDPQFKGFYGGSRLDRDLAYHQGTVWVFPLGEFFAAMLRCGKGDPKTVERVKKMLAPVEASLHEGCLGQLPEIYDGERPARSKGCFAQAWSVGEILRVYELLAKEEARQKG